jgi:GDP-L-fucose synthase
VNLGAGFEIKIGDLARKIAQVCGFKGTLRFNPSLPDGQPRRMLDTTRGKERFGFVAGTGFDDGLKRTVEWWREHGRSNRS